MKHQLTWKRVVSILLAVCMIASMLPLAGALDVSEGSDYAAVNDGNAYYRYFIPALYTHQWYNNSAVPGQTAGYTWTVFKNIWNATLGHSTNKASKLDGVSNGGVSTHYGTDQKTDAFYLHQYDLNGNQLLFGSYYGAVAPSLQMTIRVPSSDTYTLKANFYYGLAQQDDAVDFWVAPEDAEDPMADDYYFGQLTGISNGGTLDVLKFGEVGTIDLDAGEYIVTMKGANGKNLYGGNLELFGSMAPTVVDLTVDDTALNDEGQLEVPAGDEDGVWISIYGEDRDFGELDLIEWDAPTYVRVDEYSDMITASYEDGMVNVKASFVGENPVTSATLYMEVAGAATWVEIPVKAVPGSEKILTLGHTGATDKIMANVGSYPITLSAKVDGAETAITEEDIVEVTIVDENGDVTENVTATVNGANISFSATAGGSYTALVDATIAGVSTKAAYEIALNVTDFSLSYNLMKMGGFGDVCYPTSSYWAVKDFIDSYADTWTGGSTDIKPDVKSDGWKPGAKSAACGDWWWTSSAVSLGNYFAFNGQGEWNSVDVFVPVSGTYNVSTLFSVWSAGTNVDYYIAPVGTENPIADDYKLNAAPVNHKATTIVDTTAELGTVELTAGEYMIVALNVDNSGSGAFIKSYDLTLVGEATGTKCWIDTGKTERFIQYNLGTTYWTWVQSVLPAFLADGQKVTFSSSNNNVLKVNPNTSITPVHEGMADLILTATDGATATIPFVVGAPDVTYGFHNAAVAAYTASGGNCDLTKYPYVGNGYATAEEGGFGPWYIYDSTSNYPNTYFEGTTYYFGCYWATSVKNNGMNTGLGGGDAYTQFAIRVDADGEYAISSTIDYNSIGWSPHDIYLAPADAENLVADEYKLCNITGTRAASGKAMAMTLLGVADLEAGDYVLSYVKDKSSANRSTAVNTVNNIDYLNVSNVYFYKLDKAPAVALDTVDGAQIRTSGIQGLRFTSSFAKSGDYAAIKEVGTVLIPTADLTADEDLVIGYSANGHDALVVPAVKYFGEDDLKITYTAVLIDIAEANYGRAISARSYAIVTDVYGNDHTIYGDAVTSRSVLQVAQNGLLDPNASEEDKAIFQEIVDAANA